MIAVRQRLFWKIYLTLLSSLVAVAVLMGCFWWLLAELSGERQGDALRVDLKETLARSGGRPGAVTDAAQGSGGGVGADISLYDQNGTLAASHGDRIALTMDDGGSHFGPRHIMRIDLPDGRTVLARMRLPRGESGLHILTVVLVVAGGVGLTAFPVTARLTRRFEILRSGMERWGTGELTARVDGTGHDEVALIARTFNRAAERLSLVLKSQKALLANASHELRSPLARLRVAVELWLMETSAEIHAEIVRNLGEVDQLVDEILLSSRLDHAGSDPGRTAPVDLLGLAAEEAARVGASLEGVSAEIDGDAKLLRRLLRNLLENAGRHGCPPVEVEVSHLGNDARIVVSDRGQGIAAADRERVFEPFYRPVGRGEAGGGWGLGLALVRQIAERHGGSVACDENTGGGSRFVVQLPGRKGLDRDVSSGRP
jgi:signal transduction histidine kinase